MTDLNTYIPVFLQYVLPTLLGSTSILAVLFNWRIEQLREKNKNRRELVAYWKKSFTEIKEDQYWVASPAFDPTAYLSIRPFLTDDARRRLDKKPEYSKEGHIILRGTMPGAGPVPDTDQEILSSEIHRLEKLWDLI